MMNYRLIFAVSLMLFLFVSNDCCYCEEATYAKDSDGDLEACTFYDEVDKTHFDLSSLVKKENRMNNDYVFEAKNSHFYINICKPIVTKSDKFKNLPGTPGIVRKPTDTTASADKYQSLGSVAAGDVKFDFQETEGVCANFGTLLTDDSLSLIYFNGSFCDKRKENRITSVIAFECDRKVQGVGTPKLIHSDECSYMFAWHSPVACPVGSVPQTSSSSSSSAISGLKTFFLLLLVVLLSYIVFGTFFNYRVAGARGAEIIPHFSCIVSCVDSLKLGLNRLIYDCRQKVSGQGSGPIQYRGLDDESMENLLSEEDDEVLDDIGDTYYSEYTSPLTDIRSGIDFGPRSESDNVDNIVDEDGNADTVGEGSRDRKFSQHETSHTNERDTFLDFDVDSEV
eukprot:Nk52_evm11s311 gene=Nk52_evmTU11s311